MNKKQNFSYLDQKLIKRLFRENFHKHVKWYVCSIISMLIVAGSTSASAWIIRDVVNQVVHGHDFNLIIIIASTIAIIFIIKGISNFFQIFFLSKAGNSIVAEHQRRIYERLMQQGISFYQNVKSSDLLIRVTHSANAARNIIDTIITIIFRDLFSIIGLLIVMMIQNFLFSVITIIVVPLAFIAIRLILRRVRELVEKEVIAISAIIKFMQETSIGIRVVKTFSLEGLMQDRMNKAINDAEKRANSISRLEAATNPIMETLGGIAIASIIVFSGYISKKVPGSEADLMSFMTALLLSYEPAKRLANVRVKIESGMVGVRMMFEILDYPISVTEDKNPIHISKENSEIVFDNVSFSYNKKDYVLKNINTVFPYGKMTAIVGPSGAGKSTIINLIMRLYDPSKGIIKINGKNIKFVSFESLRRKISYVEQNTFLFGGTIFYNISLGNQKATKEQIFNAAKAANAHDFILKLKNGYHTNIGDNGINLSNGERQRIAIARAILRDSEILILDEATSSLDLESEILIREAIQRFIKNRTTIIIAHRLSTIHAADKIIVIKKGKILEEGTQNQLLNQKTSFYKRLYELQYFQENRIILNNNYEKH